MKELTTYDIAHLRERADWEMRLGDPVPAVSVSVAHLIVDLLTALEDTHDRLMACEKQ